MKKMVRCIPFLMMVVFSAVNVFAGGQGSKQAARGGKTEIVCMVQSSPEAQFVKKIAEAYMAEPGNENIVVTINELGRDNASVRIKNQLFTQSDGVDFFFTTPSLVGPLAEGGVLEDFTPYFQKPEVRAKGFSLGDFTPGGVQAGTYTGKIYGLPFTTSTMLLYYRTDLISSPPQTWDEYLATARKFTQSVTPNSPTPYGTTIVGKPQQNGINLIEYSQVLWANGGEMVGPGNDVQVNRPVNVRSLEFWSGLFRNKLTPPDANTYDYSTIVTAFQEEQVAMCIQWDAAAGEFANPERSPKIYNKYAVSIIPGTPQPDGTILRKPYHNNWLVFMNKFSSHKEETFNFIMYLCNKDVFIKNMSPSMTTALNAVISSDAFKANKESTHSYEAYRQSLAEGRSYTANRDLDTIKEILDAALSEALAGVRTSQAALDNAAKEINEVVKR